MAFRATAIVTAMGGAFVVSGPTQARAELLWGVNGHPLAAYSTPITVQLDLMKETGLKSYRVDVSDVLRADALGQLINEAKKRDIEILPVLTPGLDLDKTDPKALYAKAFNFAATIVSRFQHDVRVWELGNELENYAIIKACEMKDDGTQYNCAWGPAGGVGVDEYFTPRWKKVSAVLKGLSDGTSSVDPTIRKAIGTAGWGHVGAFERMKQDGVKWDISVWHMYGDDPEWGFKYLAVYGKPIWVTEFNTAGGSQPGQDKQAEALRKTMQRLNELKDKYSVEAAHVYELLDETYWAPSTEAFMGLYTLDKDQNGNWKVGQPKSAQQTVKAVIAGR